MQSLQVHYLLKYTNSQTYPENTMTLSPPQYGEVGKKPEQNIYNQCKCHPLHSLSPISQKVALKCGDYCSFTVPRVSVCCDSRRPKSSPSQTLLKPRLPSMRRARTLNHINVDIDMEHGYKYLNETTATNMDNFIALTRKNQGKPQYNKSNF